MRITLQNILQKPWKYFIARNLSVWHDQLCLRHEARGMQSLKLPGFFQIKVHRGMHSEFLWLETGRNSRQEFVHQLALRLRSARYVSFLCRRYRHDGQKLLRVAGHARSDSVSLRRFFDWYGRCECLLDITAVGSKVVTDRVLELVPPGDRQLDIIGYYGQPKQLSPVQCLERELAVLSKQKKNIRKNAERLHAKYCWIPINFVGEPWDVRYFAKRLRVFRPNPSLHPRRPVQLVSGEARRQLRLLSLMGDLNEYRKAVFTKANYLVRPVFDVVAKEHGLSGWSDMNLLTADEIIDLVNGHDNYQRALIAKRQQSLFMIYNDTLNSTKLVSGAIVKRLLDAFREKVGYSHTLSGTIAHRGTVRGTARVILEPGDFSRFKHGDILVAKMTSIDFVPIMRHASAFITDEGGLASHAAIIAREFGKPCIVGTRIGTSFFRDGDRVEVDAVNGIIKKL